MSETTKLLALKPSDLRKSKKPLMEKRRRERINTCLEELKKLVVDSSQKENGRYAKLEKADILEMTVKHLQAMHRTQKKDIPKQDGTVEAKFLSGFGECAKEVARYMASMSGMDNDIKNRVLRHLYVHGQTIQQQQQQQQSPQLQSLQKPTQEVMKVAIPAATQLTSLPGNVNNNLNNVGRQAVTVPSSATTVIPSTTTTAPVIGTNNKGQTFILTTSAPLVAAGNPVNATPQLGRIAFILPNAQTPGQVIPVYTNFTQVNPTNEVLNFSKAQNEQPQQPVAVQVVKDNDTLPVVMKDTSEHIVPSRGTSANDVINSSVEVNNNVENTMWRPW